jgi:dimethylhistidine N-methyltransferase
MTNVDFANEVWRGLRSTPKRIPSKYLYDERGSQLFNEITQLDEYYLTRTERKIIEDNAGVIFELAPTINEIVEFGCGDGIKTEVILRRLLENRSEIKYSPIDISPSAITEAKGRIETDLPDVHVEGYVGDYFSFLKEKSFSPNHASRLFLFLGSNIGNYESSDAIRFLRSIRENMSDRDFLLIGFDMKKDISVLNAAYNDKKGVTAEFNFNLFDRMNRELGANFNRNGFSHYGCYNPVIGAMQSFLISTRTQQVVFDRIGAKIEKIEIAFGEAIHLENSFKYSFADISKLAEDSGLSISGNLTDELMYFTDSVWKKKE